MPPSLYPSFPGRINQLLSTRLLHASAFFPGIINQQLRDRALAAFLPGFTQSNLTTNCCCFFQLFFFCYFSGLRRSEGLIHVSALPACWPLTCSSSFSHTQNTESERETEAGEKNNSWCVWCCRRRHHVKHTSSYQLQPITRPEEDKDQTQASCLCSHVRTLVVNDPLCVCLCKLRMTLSPLPTQDAEEKHLKPVQKRLKWSRIFLSQRWASDTSCISITHRNS